MLVTVDLEQENLTRPVPPQTHDTEQEPQTKLMDDQDVYHTYMRRLQRILDDRGEQREQEDRVRFQAADDLFGEEVIRQPGGQPLEVCGAARPCSISCGVGRNQIIPAKPDCGCQRF
jgi:hypothetical protein